MNSVNRIVQVAETPPSQVAPCVAVLANRKEVRIYGSAGLVAFALPTITDALVMSAAEARDMAMGLWQMAKRSETCDPNEIVVIEP